MAIWIGSGRVCRGIGSGTARNIVRVGHHGRSIRPGVVALCRGIIEAILVVRVGIGAAWRYPGRLARRLDRCAVKYRILAAGHCIENAMLSRHRDQR